MVLDKPQIIETDLVGEFTLVQSLPVYGVPINYFKVERALQLVEKCKYNVINPTKFNTEFRWRLTGLEEYSVSINCRKFAWSAFKNV